jgi:ribosomal small subunit protein bTHX
MGRGDIKTKKGKTKAGSFGKIRPAKVAQKVAVTKSATAVEKVVAEKVEKKVATKKAK